MIDAVDKEIRDWAKQSCVQIAPEATFSLDSPCAHPERTCVHTYLTHILPAQPDPSSRHSTPSFTLNYVVTACSTQVSLSHKILGDLLFAAYEDPRFNVDFDIEINQLWHSLNIPLRPGFVLQTALRKSTEQVVNRVTQPASIRSTSTSTTTLTGIVLGPRDIPIPGAKITLLNLGRWTNTDNQGQFQFAATLPTDNGERLRVEAKGLNIEFDTAEIPHADKKPLILKLNELEE